MTHGGPDAEVRHVGDLGNVHADSTGSSRSFIVLKGTVKLNARFFNDLTNIPRLRLLDFNLEIARY